MSNIRKSYNDKRVLVDVSLSVEDDENTFIIGPNGSGKSTLLRILADVDRTFRGHRAGPSRGDIAYVPQEITYQSSDRTVLQHLHDQAIHSETIALAIKAMHGMGLSRKFDLERRLCELSGGEKRKLELSIAFSSQAELACLDEPTNDLDAAGIHWLQSAIQNSSIPIVSITHNSELLEDSLNRYIRIEDEGSSIVSFRGLFQDYLEMKSRQLSSSCHQYLQAKEEKKRLEQAINKKRNWAIKGQYKKPKDNDKGRIKAARERSMKSARQAKAMETRYDRLPDPTKPFEKPVFRWDLQSNNKSHRPVISVINATVGYSGHFELGPIDLNITAGSKWLIKGHNGIGKTTLLRSFTEPGLVLDGKIEVKPNVRIEYLSQEICSLRQELSILHYLVEESRSTTQQCMHALSLAQFHRSRCNELVSELSSGELVKLVLCCLSLKSPQVIVLDEPTNHLDFEACQIVIDALSEYDGTLVIVTHEAKFEEALPLIKVVHLEEISSKRFVHPKAARL
nr:ATP-binding cassette domain-containing protein [Pelagicoccus albus]